MNIYLIPYKNSCFFLPTYLFWHQKKLQIGRKCHTPFWKTQKALRVRLFFLEGLVLFILVYWFKPSLKIVKQPWFKEVILFCNKPSNDQKKMAIFLFLTVLSFLSLYFHQKCLNLSSNSTFWWKFWRSKKYNWNIGSFNPQHSKIIERSF